MVNKTKKVRKGGKVLSSGGFGCIFKPALKCKQKNRMDNYVSKLMKKKNAKIEFDDVEKYLPQLQKIPEYSHYFLVSKFSTCIPDKLTNSDLEGFDEKCSALEKIGLNKNNVNANLTKLMSVNMPYGGIDVGDYINEINLDYDKTILLNKSLIQLLKNGIIPMNDMHIYHCDIKESNVLVDDSNNEFHTRLIDWGLSTTFNNENKIPQMLYNRPFQYNVPFSVILLNDFFNSEYKDFLDKNPNPNYILIRTFVIHYVINWVNKRGPGHLKTLNNIFKKLFENELINVDENFKEQLIEFNFTFYFIFDYIAKILFKYTKNNKIDIMEYFSEVFIKNLDIWGFTMIYSPILDFLYNKLNKLNNTELKIYKKLRSLIMIIVESSTVPIDIDKLVDILEELNPLFLEANKNNKLREKKINTIDLKSNNSKTLKNSRRSRSRARGRSFIRSLYRGRK